MMLDANGNVLRPGDVVTMACGPDQTFGFFPGQDEVVRQVSSTCVELKKGRRWIARADKEGNVLARDGTVTYMACLLRKV